MNLDLDSIYNFCKLFNHLTSRDRILFNLYLYDSFLIFRIYVKSKYIVALFISILQNILYSICVIYKN